MKGKPWRPSTRHSGWRVRTHIKEDDDDNGVEQDEEEDQPVEVHIQEDDIDVSVEEVKKSQDMIFNRAGVKYNFTIKAKDVYKYSPTDGCNGCKFAMGEVTFQCGHTPACKKRMIELMEDDPYDKQRVKNWYIEKGIDVKKEDLPPMEVDRPSPAPRRTMVSAAGMEILLEMYNMRGQEMKIKKVPMPIGKRK